MYTTAVICVVFTAVSASWGPLIVPRVLSGQPEPERCRSASAYTYKADSVITSVKDGSLFTELVHQRGAYDAVYKRIAIEEVLGFSNDTEDTIKLISDYHNGVRYRITTQKGTTKCEKMEISTRFPYNFLPEKSKFVNKVTIGDRALTAANWYVLYTDGPTEDVHVVYSFQYPECVDLGYTSRATDKATGAELWIDSHTRSDYSLGICDPEEWFEPPQECQTAQLLKMIPQHRFGRLSPPGKRPAFL